jgi:hypothetical protein
MLGHHQPFLPIDYSACMGWFKQKHKEFGASWPYPSSKTLAACRRYTRIIVGGMGMASQHPNWPMKLNVDNGTSKQIIVLWRWKHVRASMGEWNREREGTRRKRERDTDLALWSNFLCKEKSNITTTAANIEHTISQFCTVLDTAPHYSIDYPCNSKQIGLCFCHPGLWSWCRWYSHSCCFG